MIYEAVNQPVLLRVPQSSRRVLDIGCGSGAFGRALKEHISCKVVGVTVQEDEAKLARQALDEVIVGDATSLDLRNLGTFDCIVLSHILEHLLDPEGFLRKLCDNLEKNGTLLVALPNALYFKQRFEFLSGKFRYTAGGIMDSTHVRFFDWTTARELIEHGGYVVTKAEASGHFPLPFARKVLPQASLWVDSFAARTWPGLFGDQFVFTCRNRETI